MQSSDNEDLELNSGVQFPGENLEPLQNVLTTLDDETLEEGVLSIEYKLNPESSFAFTFMRNQRVTVAKCEFCN